MIKIQMFVLSALFSFLAAPLVAHADGKQDPLQNYRDEIKRMEANASQAVLDQLKANDSSPMPSQSAPAASPPRSFSNTEKAFSPPTATQNNTTPSTNKPGNDNNPWLKPNPWEAQAHVNPWANAPIPSAGNTIPPPPNIFAPPHPAVNTPNKTTNNNTNH